MPLDTVAQSLGVTAPALLKRFGSKRHLLFEALAPPEAPPFLKVIAEGPTQDPLVDQMTHIALEIGSFLQAMLPRLAAIRASNIIHRMMQQKFTIPPPVRTLDSLTEWFSRAETQGLTGSAPSPKTKASLMFGAIHIRIFLSFISHEATEDPDEFDNYLRTSMDLLARSFTPEEKS